MCLEKTERFMRARFDGGVLEGHPAGPVLRTFTLGAVSRSVAAAVFCPITVVKTRMVRRAPGAAAA